MNVRRVAVCRQHLRALPWRAVRLTWGRSQFQPREIGLPLTLLVLVQGEGEGRHAALASIGAVRESDGTRGLLAAPRAMRAIRARRVQQSSETALRESRAAQLRQLVIAPAAALRQELLLCRGFPWLRRTWNRLNPLRVSHRQCPNSPTAAGLPPFWTPIIKQQPCRPLILCHLPAV